MKEILNDRAEIVLNDPDALNVLFDHVANGGSLNDVCKMWQISFHKVIRRIKSDKILNEKLLEAKSIRDEYYSERLFKEVSDLSTFNLKDIFHEDGSMKRPHELPDNIMAAIKEIDADGGLKFQDKLKALELLSRRLGLFVEKREVSGRLTLEQAVLRAMGEVE